MGKKLRLTSLLYKMKDHNALPPPPSWPWPSCGQLKTSSFRKEIVEIPENDSQKLYNGVNLSYFEFSSSDSNLSNSAVMDCECVPAAAEVTDTVEAVVRGLRSDRLFYEPGTTSSIVDENISKRIGNDVPFGGSIAMAMESKDPYRDFKVSMQEMVMAHGVKNWEWLEEMLVWYLRANGKNSHSVIIGAFLDLLMSIASSSSSSFSSSSIGSSCTTFEIEEDELVAYENHC